MIVLAADPGGRDTGLCVRDGMRVLEHRIVTRSADEDLVGRGVGVGPAYVAEVLAAIAELARAHGPDLIATEGVTSPGGWKNGKVEPINPSGLIGAGIVLGGILGTYPAAVVVPPGKNGSMPLGAYPDELVGPRERSGNWRMKVGAGRLRHARSAFDVAGTAVMHARMRASQQA